MSREHDVDNAWRSGSIVQRERVSAGVRTAWAISRALRATPARGSQWLSWRIGMSLGTAREHVRIAGALAKLPLIDAAMSRGEVSYSKVRAMTRTASAATEATLLDMARSSTAAQLEKICRRYRQIEDASAEASRGLEDRRWVRVTSTDDGMMRIEIQVLPEEGARS